MTTSPLNAMAARLEAADALDGPAEAIGRTVRGLIPEGAPKAALSGAWLGHALHPLVTDVPIGTWTSSVLLDWAGGPGSRSAADRLLLAGLLAAGTAVATGWSDWADSEARDPRVRRSGLVHAVANGTATALMAGSYAARRRGARGRGKLLSLAGSAALGCGGWLGGHLSYTLGAGVDARAAHAHHSIDYIEIAVTDIDAAKAFYASAFGWAHVDYGPDYAGIQSEGKEVGGLRRDSEVRAGGPLVILYSEDLERSVERVTAAGGTIVEPIYAFPGGRRFHFADPAGNELAVWSDRSG